MPRLERARRRDPEPRSAQRQRPLQTLHGTAPRSSASDWVTVMQLRVQRTAHSQLGQWYFSVLVFSATLSPVALAVDANQPTDNPSAAAARARRAWTRSRPCIINQNTGRGAERQLDGEAGVGSCRVRGESVRSAPKTRNGTRAVAVPRGHAASSPPPGSLRRIT